MACGSNVGAHLTALNGNSLKCTRRPASSQAETSAAELAALKALILSNRVSAIFTEVGTSPKVALSLAGDAKVKAVPLAMHSLPQGGGYEDYLRRLATTITGALEP